MNTVTMSDFAAKTAARGRITFADVQRLQRDCLRDGLTTRDEAELLIALDGSVRSADPSFARALVVAVTDLVVWGERPTGHVPEEAAAWLTGALGQASPKTRVAVLRAVAEEAHAFENEALATLVRCGAARPGPVPAEEQALATAA